MATATVHTFLDTINYFPMKKICVLFSAMLAAACTVDYDMKPTNVAEADMLVINGFMNPTKPVCIYFHAINRTDTGFVHHAANDLHVKLMEDGNVLFDGVCSDTALFMDYRPKALSTYRIEASLDGYATASAETTVPDAISCRVRYEEREFGDAIFFLSDFKGDYLNNRVSLYLSSYAVEKSDTMYQSTDLYANNLLIDNLNRQDGMDPVDEEVGSSYYENFIRIKNRNIPLIDSLVFFSNMRGGYYKTRYYMVNVIAAGPEYDQYYRTFYKQTANIVYDDDISAIIYQPIQVYSNIDGGLGIFAGLNETNYYFDAPDHGEDPWED